MRNGTGTASIWIDTGHAAGVQQGTVSPSTGFEWKKDDPLVVVELDENYSLFAVVAGGQPAQTVEAIQGVKFVSADVFVV